MKVLVLNGSPKQESATMSLTSAFLRGLNSSKEHNVKIVNVMEQDIQFCRGCLSCWFHPDSHCVIDDDMNKLLDEIAACDLLLLSFPLYFHGIPAPLKAVLDRTNPFLSIDMNLDGDKVTHTKKLDLTAKRTIILTGCGFPYYPDNFTPLKAQLKLIFGSPVMLCVYETPLLGIPIPALAPLKQGLLSRFTQAGTEYAKTGSLSDATLEALQTPLLPREQYVRIINGLKTN